MAGRRGASCAPAVASATARLPLLAASLVLLAAVAEAIAPFYVITTLAGNGQAGFGGDGGQATAAFLNGIEGVTQDPQGNVFFSDYVNRRVRRVDFATGILTTVAGTGTAAFSGDGGPATLAALAYPNSLWYDPFRTAIVVCDYGSPAYRIRAINLTDGSINTIAGNGVTAAAGDGGPATAAAMIPAGGGIDLNGVTYFADTTSQRVRRIFLNGTITAFAGVQGVSGGLGDGGPASLAQLQGPNDIRTDRFNNVAIAEIFGARIRFVNVTTGIITLLAGVLPTNPGFAGDGGLAIFGRFNLPAGLAIDPFGNLVIADRTNHRVRLVNTTGYVSTIAGTGTATSTGDGGLAIAATLSTPDSVWTTPLGDILIGELGTNANRVRRLVYHPACLSVVPFDKFALLENGVVSGSTVNGPSPYSGNTCGGSPIGAGPTAVISWTLPTPLVSGDVLTLDTCGSSFDTVLSLGLGCPEVSFSTFNCVATNDDISDLQAAAGFCPTQRSTSSLTFVVGAGAVGRRTIFITLAGYLPSDVGTYSLNYARRKVGATGAPSVSPRPPTGTSSGTPSGTPTMSRVVTSAPPFSRAPTQKATPSGIPSGAVLPTPSITPSSLNGASASPVPTLGYTIATMAGDGSVGIAANGENAIGASMGDVFMAASDANYNTLFIEDFSYRLRRIDGVDSVISTVAGNGSSAFGGDDGPPLAAAMVRPRAFAINLLGDVYIADEARIRFFETEKSTFTTVIGGGTGADFSSAKNVQLTGVTSIALDFNEQVYFVDGGNKIRVWANGGGDLVYTVAGTGTCTVNAPDGVASAMNLCLITDIAVTSTGDIVFTEGHRVRILQIAAGYIYTVAGTGVAGFSGDGGPALSATLNGPDGVALDALGNVVFADSNNNRIRRIETAAGTNFINTIAGNGVASYGGDGLAATSANLRLPIKPRLNSFQEIFFVDFLNNRIRKLVPPPDCTPIRPFSSTLVGFAGTLTANTTGQAPFAGVSFGSTSIGSGSQVLFSWKLPAPLRLGDQVIIRTCGSSFDTTVFLGTGCPSGDFSAFRTVAANDDAPDVLAASSACPLERTSSALSWAPAAEHVGVASLYVILSSYNLLPASAFSMQYTLIPVDFVAPTPQTSTIPSAKPTPSFVPSNSAAVSVLPSPSSTPPVTASPTRSTSPTQTRSNSPAASTAVPTTSPTPALPFGISPSTTPSSTPSQSPTNSVTPTVCPAVALTGVQSGISGVYTSNLAEAPTGVITAAGCVTEVGDSVNSTGHLVRINLGISPELGGILTFDTCSGVQTDTQIFVAPGCPSSGNLGFCFANDVGPAAQQCAGGAFISIFVDSVALRSPFWHVRIQGYGSAYGAYNLRWSYLAPLPPGAPPTPSPAAGACAFATQQFSIAGPSGSLSGTLVGGPVPFTAASVCTTYTPGTSVIGHTFRFDLGFVPELGSSITFNTCTGTSFDTMLFYSWGCPSTVFSSVAATCVGVDDNCGVQSSVTIAFSTAALQNQVSWLFLQGYGGATGTYGLAWSYAPPTPTQTPTQTHSVGASDTPTGTQTQTRTPSQTPTSSFTGTRTQSPTPTQTTTPSLSNLATPSQTQSPSTTPTQTGTQTAASTPASTVTATATIAPSATGAPCAFDGYVTASLSGSSGSYQDTLVGKPFNTLGQTVACNIQASGTGLVNTGRSSAMFKINAGFTLPMGGSIQFDTCASPVIATSLDTLIFASWVCPVATPPSIFSPAGQCASNDDGSALCPLYSLRSSVTILVDSPQKQTDTFWVVVQAFSATTVDRFVLSWRYIQPSSSPRATNTQTPTASQTPTATASISTGALPSATPTSTLTQSRTPLSTVSRTQNPTPSPRGTPGPVTPADLSYIIVPVQGTAFSCSSIGDGGPATAARINNPHSSTVDAFGNMYVVERAGARIRRFSNTSIVTTFAGNGVAGNGGNNGPATSANINLPVNVRINPVTGNVHFAEQGAHTVRSVDPNTGIITIYAGTSNSAGFSGDGGAASSALLNNPSAVAFSALGDMAIADLGNNRIRLVNFSTRIITTVVGTGTGVSGGDGLPATSGTIWGPHGVTFAPNGDLLIAEFTGCGVRRVDLYQTRTITRVAGTPGVCGNSGEGYAANLSSVTSCSGVAVDAAGRIYIADREANRRIRMVNPVTGTMHIIAGTGVGDSTGDFGPATAATFSVPHDVSLLPSGDVLVADTTACTIRRLYALPACDPVRPYVASFSAGSGSFAGSTASELTPYPGASMQGITIGVGKQAFFAWTLPAPLAIGDRISIDTCGSDFETTFDTTLAVGGTCPGFDPVSFGAIAANDDVDDATASAGFCPNRRTSSAVFITVGSGPLVGIRHLFIIVGGYAATDAGNFKLQYTYQAANGVTPSPSVTPRPPNPSVKGTFSTLPTSSSTRTQSPTPSNTATQTGTGSPSNTVTPSVTPTQTSSVSGAPSISGTPSNPASASIAASITGAGSSTPSFSGQASSIPTRSIAPTPSPTRAPTGLDSPARTSTPTRSSDSTGTTTPTPTPTRTPPVPFRASATLLFGTAQCSTPVLSLPTLRCELACYAGQAVANIRFTGVRSAGTNCSFTDASLGLIVACPVCNVGQSGARLLQGRSLQEANTVAVDTVILVPAPTNLTEARAGLIDAGVTNVGSLTDAAVLSQWHQLKINRATRVLRDSATLRAATQNYRSDLATSAGLTSNAQISSSSTAYRDSSSSGSSDSGSAPNNTAAIVGGVIGAVAFIVIVVVVLALPARGRKHKSQKEQLAKRQGARKKALSSSKSSKFEEDNKADDDGAEVGVSTNPIRQKTVVNPALGVSSRK